jgi:UDP-glucose 4-epimerase
MRVLVTGACGFIGSRVCERLARDGHEVVRIVRPRRGRSSSPGGGPDLGLDLLRPGSLQSALKDAPDVVAHLAAVIPSSFVGPEAERAAQANRRMDENVFQACEALGVGAVYASSSSVYGLGGTEVRSETSPTFPVGPYAAAKLRAERTGERMLARRGLPFTALRINAPYGPGQRTRTVIRLFIERGLKGLPLLYHGTGSRQQDFTHVDDVADAVCRACRAGRGGLYNISSGSPVTMRRLAELVVRCLPGCASRVGPSGEEDAQEGAGASYSIERAARLLGWQPRVSLEDGIRDWAAAWPVEVTL